MDEKWKIINDFYTPLWVSNLGRFRGCHLKFLTPQKMKSSNGYEGRMYLKLRNKLGKQTSIYAHQLVAKCYLEIPKTHSWLKKIKFKDGDINNLSASNLEYIGNEKTKIRRRKLRKVFNSEISLICEEISKNTNIRNLEINRVVLDFITGSNNNIWNLYEKYKGYYLKCLDSAIFNTKITQSKKSIYILKKEISETKEDLIMDGFIYCLEKLKKGRFDGRNFKNWSTVVIMNFSRKWKNGKLQTK